MVAKLELGSFRLGASSFPLTSDTTNSLLRDADPALYGAMSFLAWALDNYVGDRLLAQGAIAKPTLNFQCAVVTTASLEPSPFLLNSQFGFPLFCLYRKQDDWSDLASAGSQSTSTWEFAYVLPPLTHAQSVAIEPVLRAASAVLRRSITMGWDPGYNDGENVWATYGIQKARLTRATYSGFGKIDALDQIYRGLVGTVSVQERELPNLDEFNQSGGASISIGVRDTDGTVEDGIVEVSIVGPPVISGVTPSSGDALGGDTVVIEGTGFRVGTRPVVMFDGAIADAVEVLSDTAISCITPPHSAFTSFVADLVIVATDGQTASLDAAFTFNA